MPPILKASESKRGEAEDIGRNIRQRAAAVAATGVLLHLVGVSATGLLHPGRHLEQLHERIGKGRIGLLADNGLGRTKSQLQLAINKFLYTIFSASRAEQNHTLIFSTNMIVVIQFLSLQMPGDHHPVRPRFCHGGLVPTNPQGRSTGDVGVSTVNFFLLALFLGHQRLLLPLCADRLLLFSNMHSFHCVQMVSDLKWR